MSADKLAENTLNYLPKLSAQAQKFGILMKKILHWESVVRGCQYLVNLGNGKQGFQATPRSENNLLDFFSHQSRNIQIKFSILSHISCITFKNW